MPSQGQAAAPAQQQQRAAVVGSTRWYPTPEQLMILEEMYRGGLRTPSASQIQQITAQLAAHGRIEGKNVFYWFQIHKARDRQKLRRRLCRIHHLLSCAQYHAAHHHHAFLGVAAARAAPARRRALRRRRRRRRLRPPRRRPAALPDVAHPGCRGGLRVLPPQHHHHLRRCTGGGPARRRRHSPVAGDPTVPRPSGRAEEGPCRRRRRLGELENFGVSAPDDAVTSTTAATVIDMGPPGFEVTPLDLEESLEYQEYLDVIDAAFDEGTSTAPPSSVLSSGAIIL
ncbi:hypothetical protein ACP4OV_016547 [Aristida adscensionis]